MTRRLIAILLTVALLLTVTPTAVFAAHLPTDQPLSLIRVAVDVPMAQREAMFDAAVNSNAVYNSVHIYTDWPNVDGSVRGVRWYDQTADRYLKQGDSFESSHAYTVDVMLVVGGGASVYFPETTTALVNGDLASIERQNDYVCRVSYDFGVCKEPPADLSELSFGGVLRPVPGQNPLFAVAIDEAKMERDFNAGTAFVDGVAWLEKETSVILEEGDVFKAGYTYSLFLQLKVKEPYRFAVQNGVSAVTATVDGVEATNITSQVNSDPSRVLKLQCDFVCVETDAVGGGAGRIDLRIPYPVNDTEMSFSPTLYGAHCELGGVTNPNKNIYNSVQWTNRANGGTYPENICHSLGHEYSVSILVRAESVLQDEQRLKYVLHEDGTASPYVCATVNGFPARVEPYGDVHVAQMLKVTFDFPACNATKRTIDDIDLRSLDVPVADQTPSTYTALHLGYQETSSQTVTTAKVQWLELGTENEDVREMTASDRFVEGRQYGALLFLRVDALTSFAEKDGAYSGALEVRGAEWARAEWSGGVAQGRVLMVGVLFTALDKYSAPITKVDVIGAVEPCVGYRPVTDVSLAESAMPYVQVTAVRWRQDGVLMGPQHTFQKGRTYAMELELETVAPYGFRIVEHSGLADFVVTVNGKSGMYDGLDGSTGYKVSGGRSQATVLWHFGTLSDNAASGVTDYVEISELMRPAPGQTPDFNVDIDSPYTEFGGVRWYELDTDGNAVNELLFDDYFHESTRYRAEVRVLPSAGRTIDLDQRGATLNNETAMFYYLPGEAVTVYAEYDTADCITDVNVADVQYPIPGKTPDTTAYVDHSGVAIVPYQNGSDLDWCYETNPGTSGAGFAALDGKFKSDRRHQAYVTMEAQDGYWFATDKDGNLAVNVMFDRVPVTFAYTTDSHLADGAISSIEAARTYALAKTVGGVFVDGLWLYDGMYLSSKQYGVQSEYTVDKSGGYAYYENSVLTLHDFSCAAQGDYDGIDSYRPLTVKAEGESKLYGSGYGICASSPLTFSGDGALKIATRYTAVFASDTVTVESGTWDLQSETYEGVWLFDDMTMNGGVLQTYGPNGGLYGEENPTVTLNGGTLIASARIDCAIDWCDVQLANGAVVTVSERADGQNAVAWDKLTPFDEYAYVCVTFEKAPDVLLGDMNFDGNLNTMDALLLFGCVNGARAMTAEQEAVADYTQDGNINMMDALRLFKTVSGQ